MTVTAYTQRPAGSSWSTILPDFDFESYSEAGYYWDGPARRWRGVTKTDPGLPAVGAAVYTEHPSCEVLSLAYDLKDGRGDRLWTPGQPPPQDLFAHIAAGHLLEAWNSGFEFWLWHNVCHRRMGWPALPFWQLRCAMSKARAHSLPGALGEAAKALQAGEQKDAKGAALLRKLSVPKSPTKRQITAALRGSDSRIPGAALWYHAESDCYFVDHIPLPGTGIDAAHCVDVTEVLGHRAAASLRGVDYAAEALRIANRPTPETYPEDFKALYAYNRQDIKAEAAISAMCPDLSQRELELWLLDQAINFRGVYIDQAALNNCIAIVDQATERYTAELRTITGGVVQTAGEIEEIRRWLGAHGCQLANLDAEAIEKALKRTDITGPCRRVLEIRDTLGAASVKKLFAIQRRLPQDGRLRDLFAFCGADRTGRWAGRGPQPQNLPSSGPKVCRCAGCGRVFWKGLILCPECHQLRGPEDSCDWGIDAVEACLRDIATRSLAHVESMWGDAVAAVSGCLRGLFSATPGHDLICADFSAIEAVVLAELAGEEWRQEVFRTHGKIYEMSASKITGTPFEDFAAYKKQHGAHHPLRKKIGKVAELGSGYGGGWAAWCNFGADEFMSEEEGRQRVKEWRAASPMIAGDYKRGIRGFWYGLQDAAFAAVTTPGYCYSYQAPATRFNQPPPITYYVHGDILYCILPSGRQLTYHQPRLVQRTGYNGRAELALTYWGYNTDYKKGPKGWMELDTWGGKLTENVVQAVARDILGHSMPALERGGYPIVLHVHDEIVSEVPAGTGDVAEFERVMGVMPPWAADWPIKAAGGWRGQRYRKD